MKLNQNLNHVAIKIIQTYKKAGMDDGYIEEKKKFVLKQNEYESLHWAIRNLDNEKIIIFSKLFGASVKDLNQALKVLDKV